MDLSYFVGKCCTVITHAMNRNFKEESPETFPKPLFTYFVGFVEQVDSEGVWIEQLENKLKTFFFKHSVIAIAEEQVVTDDGEESIENVLTAPSPTIPSLEIAPLDVDYLTSQISQMRERYDL